MTRHKIATDIAQTLIPISPRLSQPWRQFVRDYTSKPFTSKYNVMIELCDDKTQLRLWREATQQIMPEGLHEHQSSSSSHGQFSQKYQDQLASAVPFVCPFAGGYQLYEVRVRCMNPTTFCYFFIVTTDWRARIFRRLNDPPGSLDRSMFSPQRNLISQFVYEYYNLHFYNIDNNEIYFDIINMTMLIQDITRNVLDQVLSSKSLPNGVRVLVLP